MSKLQVENFKLDRDGEERREGRSIWNSSYVAQMMYGFDFAKMASLGSLLKPISVHTHCAHTPITPPTDTHLLTQTDTCACAHPLISPPNGLSNSGSQPNLPHVTHTQSRKGVAAAVCGSGGVVWSRWAPHCAVCCAKGLP